MVVTALHLTFPNMVDMLDVTRKGTWHSYAITVGTDENKIKFPRFADFTPFIPASRIIYFYKAPQPLFPV